MKPHEAVIHSDPQIMGGTPVFIGTRVPLQTLLDYLEAGQPLDDFLDDFPTVARGAGGSSAGTGDGGAARTCAVVVLVAPSNRLRDLQPLIPRLLDMLQRVQPRAVTLVDAGPETAGAGG